MATVRSDLERSDLIEETIKLVRGEKEAQGLIWDQTLWCSELDCGTAFCVAGSVAHHAGYVPTAHSDTYWKRPRGIVDHHIQDLGQDLLGLEDDESTWLFGHVRTKREVLGALRRLSAGKTITGSHRTNATRATSPSEPFKVLGREVDTQRQPAPRNTSRNTPRNTSKGNTR